MSDSIWKAIIAAGVPLLIAALFGLLAKLWAWITAKTKGTNLEVWTKLAATAVAAAKQNNAIVGNDAMKAYALNLLLKAKVPQALADALIEEAVKEMNDWGAMYAPVPAPSPSPTPAQ